MYAIIHFFLNEKPSPTSPGTKPSSKPNWHRLPNWEPGLLSRIVECSPAPTRSPLAAKTSQMGIQPIIPSQIQNFQPQTRPTASALPNHHFWHCLHLFTTAPNPYPNSPALLYTPALSSGTPGISTILPAQPKNTITNPNQPRHHGNTPFFWVVGNTRCGLMIWFRQVLVLIHESSI
jgi:hypothetical protein